jgi:hypothetical protein
MDRCSATLNEHRYTQLDQVVDNVPSPKLSWHCRASADGVEASELEAGQARVL